MLATAPNLRKYRVTVYTRYRGWLIRAQRTGQSWTASLTDPAGNARPLGLIAAKRESLMAEAQRKVDRAERWR